MSETVIFQDNTPALSFKISQEYFENNLIGEESNFELENGFYFRTIQQDDLVLDFDSTDDGKFLTILCLKILISNYNNLIIY